MVSGMVEGTYNFTLTAINRNHLATSDMVTVSVSPHPMKLYMLQVLLEEEEAAEVNPFSLADQVSPKFGTYIVRTVGAPQQVCM